MAKTLVIVESPTKAKTISKYLGADFRVESSMGHVRDLPKSSMGIDIEGGTFAPQYEIPSTKKKKVQELKKLAKDADDILFATDEDREGEAISWHLAELLGVSAKQVKRLVFHEITKTAIQRAIEHPRELNMHLVDAQQARRVLDRLVGYELSPLLWKKVRYGLSAGRVQSVAVHVVVEREKERARFHASTYFDLLATLASKDTDFPARLVTYQDKPLATGKDFDGETGVLKKPEAVALLTEQEAATLANTVREKRPWTVTDVTETPYQTHPYPPFITSTLQQEASRKLGMSARQSMRTAQSLYENGYITYMRTDSVHLSDEAVAAARQAANEFGANYVADGPKQYESKSKSAQEAHEAIRPAGATFMHPEEVRREVSLDEAKLYDLIWKRTVAGQMKSADMIRVSATITVANATFEAKGKRIKFAGYLRAYVEGADDPDAELDDKEVHLPPLRSGETVTPKDVVPESHTTLPPARYTEASLIKKLEQEGVGRPSTYATILDTIVEREYVVKEQQALIPTFTAMIVDEYLQKYFARLVDVHFTSTMEEDLDRVARGEQLWQPYIKHFYYDDPTLPFHKEVELASLEETYPTIILGLDPETNQPIHIKSGKYGPYVQLGEGETALTASIPDGLPPAELQVDQAVELLKKPQGPQVITTDPTTGKEITYRTGRFGPYIQIGEDEDIPGEKKKKVKKAKKVGLTYGPKHVPITRTFDIKQLTSEQAILVASLPRTIGAKDGEPIKVSVGRFGPYIACKDDFRSVPKDSDIFTITEQEALAILATEKKTRGSRATVLKELGKDPDTEKPVQILEGKYGPYVSNGTRTFASVPKDVPTDTVTLEQALTLLKEKKKKKKK